MISLTITIHNELSITMDTSCWINIMTSSRQTSGITCIPSCGRDLERLDPYSCISHDAPGAEWLVVLLSFFFCFFFYYRRLVVVVVVVSSFSTTLVVRRLNYLFPQLLMVYPCSSAPPWLPPESLKLNNLNNGKQNIYIYIIWIDDLVVHSRNPCHRHLFNTLIV